MKDAGRTSEGPAASRLPNERGILRLSYSAYQKCDATHNSIDLCLVGCPLERCCFFLVVICRAVTRRPIRRSLPVGRFH